MEKLEAVIEAPLIETETPWRVSATAACSFVRLWRNTTDDETGLVVYQLADYNQIEVGGQAADVLARIINAEGLILPGGARNLTPGMLN